MERCAALTLIRILRTLVYYIVTVRQKYLDADFMQRRPIWKASHEAEQL